MNDTETLLRTTLQSVAANTHPQDRLHEIVTQESVQPRSASKLLLAAAVFVVIGVGLGATFLVTAGGDERLESAVGAAGSATTTMLPAEAVAPAAVLPSGDPWPLPRLALDIDQLDSTRSSTVKWVSAYSELVPADAELVRGMPYLQVLRRSADSFESPMIWIETNDHASDYVASGAAEAESFAQFTIHDTTFYLLEDGDRRVLSADIATDGSVYITGLGVDASDLVEFAELLVDASPAPGWTVASPPSGMSVMFEGRLPGIYDEPGYASQMAQWEDATPTGDRAAGVSLLVDSWGEAGFESSLYQTAGRVTDRSLVRSGTVRGHTAAIVFYEDGPVAVWRDTDDATAFLRANLSDKDSSMLSDEDNFDDILTAVIEVDEATWLAMEEATPADEPEVTPVTSLPSNGSAE
jgi:hypothetical protein